MVGILCLLLAAICIGVAVIAAIEAAGARRRAVVERLAFMIEHGLNATSGTDVSAYLEPEQRQSLLSALATWLGGLAAGRFTAVSEDAIREQLIAAGMYTASPRTVLGYRMLGTVGLPALMFAAVRFHSMLDVLLVLLAAFSGWVLPMTYVSRRARKRTELIDRSLPDLIDLLCVMIEAGLSFTAAMRQASDQFGPPLGDELRLTLQEQTMGLSIDEALAHMAERADTPAMRAGRAHGHLDRPDHAQPLPRDAPSAPRPGGGAGSEDADPDPVPAGLSDLPGDVHHHHDAGRDQPDAQPQELLRRPLRKANGAGSERTGPATRL
jgi:tight adherence protein C